MNAITTPGIYTIPEGEYHADPVPGGSLSSTGARKLIPPSTPAHYHHDLVNGQAPRDAFDFGKAAHLYALGTGAELVIVDADDWRTKSAREAKADAHARGAVPLLADDHDRVLAMAAALREHPLASALHDPADGTPEQSMFAQDPDTGAWLRGRLDWLPNPTDGRLIIPDYKTTHSADLESIRKAVGNYRYHLQADWYLTLVSLLGLAQAAAFVFVFQEKTPPYLVNVIDCSGDDLARAHRLNRQAINTWTACREAGHWPGYGDDITHIELPVWQQDREEGLL